MVLSDPLAFDPFCSHLYCQSILFDLLPLIFSNLSAQAAATLAPSLGLHTIAIPFNGRQPTPLTWHPHCCCRCILLMLSRLTGYLSAMPGPCLLTSLSLLTTLCSVFLEDPPSAPWAPMFPLHNQHAPFFLLWQAGYQAFVGGKQGGARLTKLRPDRVKQPSEVKGMKSLLVLTSYCVP